MDNIIMLELMAKVREEAKIEGKSADDEDYSAVERTSMMLYRVNHAYNLAYAGKGFEEDLVRALAWGVLAYEKMKKEQP